MRRGSGWREYFLRGKIGYLSGGILRIESEGGRVAATFAREIEGEFITVGTEFCDPDTIDRDEVLWRLGEAGLT